MARRRIDDAEGRQALSAVSSKLAEVLAGETALNPAVLDTVPPRPALLKAVRWALEELAERAPGRAVEVRVPPAGAVQILGGTVHRRGTPPAVIEMSMSVWVLLAAGLLSWAEAEDAALVSASGERASLQQLLPLW